VALAEEAETRTSTKTIFFVGLILCATGVLSPAIALLLGLIFGLSFAHPYDEDCRTLSKFLLQASVVGMGFGMNLQEVIRTGRSGFVYTAAGIAFALTAGLLLGRLFEVKRISSILISVGTAICGGSAIAAVAPILEADQQETAVSLGTIFILNSVALLIFPAIGRALHLSQEQFGLWAALAIHDTSSVVGASSHYGPIALVVGITVKLTRALWIIPVALGAALLHRSKNRIQWPYFILLFCLATVVNTYLPSLASLSQVLSNLGKLGLTATLFLIGTSISRPALRQVGVRPLLQGVVLWILVAVSSLWLIVAGIISLHV
jgi:uncharacterized integral membrane protein (TIGR00698 family)